MNDTLLKLKAGEDIRTVSNRPYGLTFATKQKGGEAVVARVSQLLREKLLREKVGESADGVVENLSNAGGKAAQAIRNLDAITGARVEFTSPGVEGFQESTGRRAIVADWIESAIESGTFKIERKNNHLEVKVKSGHFVVLDLLLRVGTKVEEVVSGNSETAEKLGRDIGNERRKKDSAEEIASAIPESARGAEKEKKDAATRDLARAIEQLRNLEQRVPRTRFRIHKLWTDVIKFSKEIKNATEANIKTIIENFLMRLAQEKFLTDKELTKLLRPNGGEELTINIPLEEEESERKKEAGSKKEKKPKKNIALPSAGVAVVGLLAILAVWAATRESESTKPVSWPSASPVKQSQTPALHEKIPFEVRKSELCPDAEKMQVNTRTMAKDVLTGKKPQIAAICPHPKLDYRQDPDESDEVAEGRMWADIDRMIGNEEGKALTESVQLLGSTAEKFHREVEKMEESRRPAENTWILKNGKKVRPESFDDIPKTGMVYFAGVKNEEKGEKFRIIRGEFRLKGSHRVTFRNFPDGEEVGTQLALIIKMRDKKVSLRRGDALYMTEAEFEQAEFFVPLELQVAGINTGMQTQDRLIHQYEVHPTVTIEE